MGLSFRYEFTAPTTTTVAELESFMHEVQQLAQSLGFDPTSVLDVPFDTPERREFANRLGERITMEGEWRKGVAIPAPGQLRHHNPEFRRGSVDFDSRRRARRDR